MRLNRATIFDASRVAIVCVTLATRRGQRRVSFHLASRGATSTQPCRMERPRQSRNASLYSNRGIDHPSRTGEQAARLPSLSVLTMGIFLRTFDGARRGVGPEHQVPKREAVQKPDGVGGRQARERVV